MPASNRNAQEGGSMSTELNEWPLWEVFVRSKAGLDHKHCGSLHAADAAHGAADGARCLHPAPGRQQRLGGALDQIVASDPGDKDMLFDPAEDKVYRHPTFYKLPDSVDHM
jgi:ring-1,2-phenylacetyl-CoA epoxidase subunit PaaB